MPRRGWWTYELPPAIAAYKRGGELEFWHVTTLRAYLRNYIDDPSWVGADNLRSRVPTLIDRRTIAHWLHDASLLGINDPFHEVTPWPLPKPPPQELTKEEL